MPGTVCAPRNLSLLVMLLPPLVMLLPPLVNDHSHPKDRTKISAMVVRLSPFHQRPAPASSLMEPYPIHAVAPSCLLSPSLV